MAPIKDFLTRDPFREITSVIRITDHDPQRVWTEIDEYIPTDKVLISFRDILDMLTDTRRGATERVCVWVSGFFGSGKSHFLKMLGYLLEDRELQDRDGHTHSSKEFLCQKLKLQDFLPLLTKEFSVRVLFINLLDYDPQDPNRPTISRSVYQNLLKQTGLSTEYWVAEWEKDLQRLNKWESFNQWVRQVYDRSWEDERRLNAEAVLKSALPELLPKRYGSSEEATQAIQDSKRRFSTINPSDVIAGLCDQAKELHPHNGRMIVLLDEVGLYIGDSVDRLTDLNALAEQVVQQGEGKVLLIATAQEALTELIPRLTRDRQILEWLRDRFPLGVGLEPTEVQTVVASRLLAKTPQGANELQSRYQAHQGTLLANLSIDRGWNQEDFVARYPFPPYAVRLVQDIMGAMRGSIDEARRLSGSERSMLKVAHAILTGEGGNIQGAEQDIGWLVSLDLFYNALAPDLTAIRSEQVRVIRDLEKVPDVNGLSVSSLAKALFLLQHLRQRHPCTVENLASTLVAHVETDINQLRQAVIKGLDLLRQNGWVVEEEGQYRLLTPEEHDLEKDVRSNWPTPLRLKEGSKNILQEMLRQFRVEFGQIRRPLKVTMTVDGDGIHEGGELSAELFTPFAEENSDRVLSLSISEPKTVFWKSEDDGDLKSVLERTLAVEDTLKQWKTRTLSPQQEEHRTRLEKEIQTTRQTKLPQLIKQAFQRGRLYLSGQEFKPSGDDMISTLRSELQNIASQEFLEFVDDRPEKEDHCAVILTWQPGSALPQLFTRQGLLTPNGQINQEAKLLTTLKAEIKRRDQKGHSRSGRDLLEHFEKIPYGWDLRLVRLLLATLFKAGVISVRYQNREITDPTDLQGRQVFQGQREFNKAVFSLLPEVDWRKAAELCSKVFGIHGGDTFERTGRVAHEQSRHWAQEATQLATRCQDNGLPPTLASLSEESAKLLNEIRDGKDPSLCLRHFLESADQLKNRMPLLQKLKKFDFDAFRKVRDFVKSVDDWAGTVSGETAKRWAQLKEDIAAEDLIERWNQINENFTYLSSRYRSDYLEAHKEFRSAVESALVELEKHEAFMHSPDKARQALKPGKELSCESDPSPDEETCRCPGCKRSFSQLSRTFVDECMRAIEAHLDALIPKPPIETIQPLSIKRTVSAENEIEAISKELHRYWRKVQRTLETHIEARVKGSGS